MIRETQHMATDHRIIGLSDHREFMQHALELAQRNLGQTWPNPAVGAVVVRDGKIIAEGFTARGGRPHAETEALKNCDAKGATLYVTLEPCSHHGKTPPCTDAIINSGIKTCVIACGDPNPQVNGEGIAQLKKAGIDVVEGVCTEEARELNRGFFSVVEKKRPYVALKIATSQDGKITTGQRHNKWITSEAARNHGHVLRSQFDAIATGIGTVLADDPMLTCRLPGLENKSPVRVVFDRKGRLPKDSQLMKTMVQVPVWSLAQPTIAEALDILTDKGITRLMVEAGQQLTTAFLQSGAVDRIYWYRAPQVIGEVGMDALANGAALDKGWKIIDSVSLSPDRLDVYE